MLKNLRKPNFGEIVAIEQTYDEVRIYGDRAARYMMERYAHLHLVVAKDADQSGVYHIYIEGVDYSKELASRHRW